jgi:predicted dehydrogenase
VKRVLFVGLGGIGQRHLRNLRTLRGNDVRIAALRSRGEQLVFDDKLQRSSGDLAQTYGLEVVTDLETALAFEPDAVFVTNPSSLHVPIAKAAAARGADLFVEKPLSHSLSGVDELIAIVRDNSLIGYVGYQLRQHPGIRRIGELLRSGALGSILFAQAEVGEHLPDFHPDEDYRRMYAARRDLGGGVVLSQIHEIDLFYGWFGVPQRVVSFGGKLSSLEIDVEDVACSLLEFERGGRRMIAELHQDFVQRPKRRRIFVAGDQGSVELLLSSGSFQVFDRAGQVVEKADYADYPRNRLFIDELSEFLSCVERREKPPVDLEDGKRSLEIALALLASQEQRQAIDVAEAA